MKKLIAAFSLLLTLLTFGAPQASMAPAQAATLNLSTGMAMGPATQPSYNSGTGKVTFAGANGMSMWMVASTLIKRNKTYRVTPVISGRSAGSVQAILTPLMMGTPTGANVMAPSLTGRTPIADDFTTANGLHTCTGGEGCGPSAHNPAAIPWGAFRMYCSSGKIYNNDPVVYANQRGVSHAHELFGNVGGLDPQSNYAYLRAHKGSTCGNLKDPEHSLNRSAYWQPTMKSCNADGYCFFMSANNRNLYYKRPMDGPTDPLQSCKTQAGSGGCVQVPHGLVMITGYDFATGTGYPQDPGGTVSSAWYGCNAGPQTNLKDAISGCGQVGDTVEEIIAFPECWDGVHLDTPNHRSHMKHTESDYCPESHPWRITEVSIQFRWTIDANCLAGRCWLSSDEMVPGFVANTPGKSFHTDYTMAWSPPVIDQMDTMLRAGQDMSAGALGDGTAIKDGGELIWSYGVAQGLLDNAVMPNRYHRTQDYGYGRNCQSNGACPDLITAAADGSIALMSYDGFVGSVDSVTIVEVDSGPQAANDNAAAPKLAANDNGFGSVALRSFRLR